LISYSAYLWHQPIFAFTRHAAVSEPSTVALLLLSLVSVVLAYFTWRYVETPFRTQKVSGKRVFSLAAVTALLIAGLGYIGERTNGFETMFVKYRLSDSQRDLYFAVKQAISNDFHSNMFTDGACRIWAPTSDELDSNTLQACLEAEGRATLLIGDSHAMNLHNILAKSGKVPFLIGITQAGCRIYNNMPTCRYDALNDFLAENGDLLGRIIYHQSGSWFVTDSQGREDSQAAFEGAFESFDTEKIGMLLTSLRDLASVADVEVTWIGPFLEYRRNPRKVFRNDEFVSINPESQRIFDELELEIEELVAQHEFSGYIGFRELFDVPESAMQGSCFMFSDIDHFSMCGEDILSQSEKLHQHEWFN
jgi:hypothetical protein